MLFDLETRVAWWFQVLGEVSQGDSYSAIFLVIPTPPSNHFQMAEALLLLKLMKKRKIGIDEVGDHTGNFGARRLWLILALGPASEFTRCWYWSKNIYCMSFQCFLGLFNAHTEKNGSSNQWRRILFCYWKSTSLCLNPTFLKYLKSTFNSFHSFSWAVIFHKCMIMIQISGIPRKENNQLALKSD